MNQSVFSTVQIWLTSDQILIVLGQKEDLSVRTQRYLCMLLPGIWCNSISMGIINWLYAMKRTGDVAVVAVALALLSPLLNYLYVYKVSISYS